jgi:hypothetical protein
MALKYSHGKARTKLGTQAKNESQKSTGDERLPLR